MSARLVVEEGDLKGLVLSLEEGESWVIGRDPDQCQLVVEDPLTSRKHLLARRTPEGISVENLSTTNPIQINEEPVPDPRLLQNGDTVKIGNELFRFYQDSAAHIVDDQKPLNSVENSHPHEELERDMDEPDTVFDLEQGGASLAEIDFGLNETGRWLLKVIGGPNTGAEFYMQAGHSYMIGTDPHTCDIVFHDTSVSRQHTRISVTEDDELFIEDLKSRNGVLIGNQRLDGKQHLTPSVIVTVGTTSFVVYDREGEMQTIISPLMPSIVKMLQKEEEEREEVKNPLPIVETVVPVEPPAPTKRHWKSYIVPVVLASLLGILGLATYSLFKEPEALTPVVQENANELIQREIVDFPAVKFSYNKANGTLLLLGHVATQADENQLLYNLQGLNFIKSVDYSGLIIDELVWREINPIIARNPAFQGITIHSPTAGQFVLSGYLQTRKQAEQLSDYLSVNFPYLDLLKKQVLVEEDVAAQINGWLQQANLNNIKTKVSNGEITLSGTASPEQIPQLGVIVQKIKEIPGVRGVTNLTASQKSDQGVQDISNQYEVTGRSRIGDHFTVVLNGRVVSTGDMIDGRTITKITANSILLEKDGAKFKIDYTP